MEDLYWPLFITVLILLFVLCVKCFGSVSVDRYEYLALLSPIDWRWGRYVREEMAKRVQKRIHLTGFNAAMSTLQSEGLVDSQYETKVIHGTNVRELSYRLTHDGAKAKSEYGDRTGRFRTIRRTGITHMDTT